MITLNIPTGQTVFVYSLILNSDSTAGNTSMFLDWGPVGNRVRRIRVALNSVFNTYNAPYFDSFVGDSNSSIAVSWVETVAGTKSATLLGWRENTSRVRDVGN